jgi:hypothetical protein
MHQCSTLRTKSFTLTSTLALLTLLLGACSTGGEGGSADAPAGLSSVSGSVVGYPFAGTSTVQAFAPNNGAQLVAGQVYPAPNSRVAASLTPVANIPPSSFVNPYFCNNVTTSPPDVMTTGVVVLGVADTGGLFATLWRATLDPSGALTVGTTFHYFFVASKAGSIRGTCVDEGIAYDYAIDLNRGWNHVTARVEAIDSFGNAVTFSYLDQAPTGSSAWYYLPLSALGSQALERDVVAAKKLVERGLEGLGH